MKIVGGPERRLNIQEQKSKWKRSSKKIGKQNHKQVENTVKKLLNNELYKKVVQLGPFGYNKLT